MREKDPRERVVTVDEAESHFAELIREVSEGDGPVMVEQDGEARIVILSLEEYLQIHPKPPKRESWQELVRKSRERIAQERAGRELPPPEEIIRWMREESDDQPVPMR